MSKKSKIIAALFLTFIGIIVYAKHTIPPQEAALATNSGDKPNQSPTTKEKILPDQKVKMRLIDGDTGEVMMTMESTPRQNAAGVIKLGCMNGEAGKSAYLKNYEENFDMRISYIPEIIHPDDVSKAIKFEQAVLEIVKTMNCI